MNCVNHVNKKLDRVMGSDAADPGVFDLSCGVDSRFFSMAVYSSPQSCVYCK